MRRFDIRDVVVAARDFERKIEAVKAKHRDSIRPGWYPYPTLSSVEFLDQLLTGEHRELSRLIGDRPMLDVGAGDGDMAFFFETMGAEVHAIDSPLTNYNRMAGIRVLKGALNSAVEIESVDLDRQFTLTRAYGLALFFGVLYHLKNPFYVLETIARHAEYCILSTRIARVSPDGRVPLRSIPVAYLVGERETNDDPTNYWIFSETGLKRLIERSGWEIRDFMTTGRRSKSDPVHVRRDERAFCLLRSRVMDFTGAVQLGDGWHEIEDGKWRWTRKSFAVVLGRPAGGGVAELLLLFYVPEVVMGALKKAGMAAEVNGAALEKCVFERAGELVYRAKIPLEALDEDPLRVRFTLDETFVMAGDDRELGVLVSFEGRSPVVVMRR